MVTGALRHTLHVFSSWLPPEPLAPSCPTHQFRSRFLYLSQVIRFWDCLLLDWEHITLCTAQSSILCSKKLGGGHILIFWYRKTEEKININIQLWLPSFKNVFICIRVPFSHSLYNAICENFKTLQYIHFFSFLTNSHAHTDTTSAYQVSKSCSCYATVPGKIMQRENKTTLKYQHQKCSHWIQPASVSPRLIPVQSFQVQPTLNWEPGKCLNIPPQLKKAFFYLPPGKTFIWELTEIEQQCQIS